jgi:hypothetical protein
MFWQDHYNINTITITTMGDPYILHNIKCKLTPRKNLPDRDTTYKKSSIDATQQEAIKATRHNFQEGSQHSGLPQSHLLNLN